MKKENLILGLVIAFTAAALGFLFYLNMGAGGRSGHGGGLLEHVSGYNFQKKVLAAGRPVLVDFWAEWCAPCKFMAPVLAEIASENRATLKVVKVDVDNAKALAAKYEIRNLPTLVLFKDGAEKKRLVGAVSKEAILNMLAQ
jgi:thioredoxin 1